MNVDPGLGLDKTTVLKEYFLNAYLIALLKELGRKTAAMAALAPERRGALPAVAKRS